MFAWRQFCSVLFFLDVCNKLAEAVFPDTKTFFGDTKAVFAEPSSRQVSQGRFLKENAFFFVDGNDYNLCSYGKKRKLSTPGFLGIRNRMRLKAYSGPVPRDLVVTQLWASPIRHEPYVPIAFWPRSYHPQIVAAGISSEQRQK